MVTPWQAKCRQRSQMITQFQFIGIRPEVPLPANVLIRAAVDVPSQTPDRYGKRNLPVAVSLQHGEQFSLVGRGNTLVKIPHNMLQYIDVPRCPAILH